MLIELFTEIREPKTCNTPPPKTNHDRLENPPWMNLRCKYFLLKNGVFSSYNHVSFQGCITYKSLGVSNHFPCKDLVKIIQIEPRKHPYTGCKPLEATQPSTPSNPQTPQPLPESSVRKPCWLGDVWGRRYWKTIAMRSRYRSVGSVGWFQWIRWDGGRGGSEGGGYPIRKVWLGSDDFPLWYCPLVM